MALAQARYYAPLPSRLPATLRTQTLVPKAVMRPGWVGVLVRTPTIGATPTVPQPVISSAFQPYYTGRRGWIYRPWQWPARYSGVFGHGAVIATSPEPAGRSNSGRQMPRARFGQTWSVPRATPAASIQLKGQQ